MAPVRDGHSTGTVPKTRIHDNGQQGQQRPRREPFINNTPNNLDQVGGRSVENGHKSGVRRSRKTSNAEIASTQLGAAGLPSSDGRLQRSKENLSRSNHTPVPELTVCMDRSGSSASSSVRSEPRRSAKAQNMDERDEAAAAKNINVAKMPNREEVQSRLEHLQAYINQTTKLTEMLQDKPEARHRLQYNKLVTLVAELKDSEDKLRSIIRGFDAVDATSEAFKRELKEDDLKVKSIKAYAQILDTQRTALEAAASGSVNNQLREVTPSANESVDAGKVSSQLENIQSRIQNLHDLQDNRSELAHLLGERDQQLSNEFQLVQNKLRDLHLKKALMNKLIEQVENGMPALVPNVKESPGYDNTDADDDEETDSSNDESLADAELEAIYPETAAMQSREDFFREITSVIGEFQSRGIVNPLTMSQHMSEEREAAYELFNSQAQPHLSALDAQHAQDLMSIKSEPREEASASRGSSVKRDNNSRVSGFGKNSSKAPKKVNEERISNARLANLKLIISQITDQYSQGLPLADELLNSLSNQSDLVMADNENQARMMSLRESRSQSRDSLASQNLDEMHVSMSGSDKRVRSSHANSSSSFDENSACIQHNLARKHSCDLVDVSQAGSSSTDEAASSSFGELSYEKKKSNAGACPPHMRPSIEELRDMTNSLQQQTLGMREHAASIANAAREVQFLKSKLPLREKKTNPQAVSQQMLSELQARKGEFEGLMSKHKGCSSLANQDVSDKPQVLGAESMQRSYQPAATPQDSQTSVNEARSFSPISTDEQETTPTAHQPRAHRYCTPLNNSASNLAHTHNHQRSRPPTEMVPPPRTYQSVEMPIPQFNTSVMPPSLVPQPMLTQQQIPSQGQQMQAQSLQQAPPPMQQNNNNFWPRAPGGSRMDQGNGMRPEQVGATNRAETIWQRCAPGEQEQGASALLTSQQQTDMQVNLLFDLVRTQQTDIFVLKAAVNNLLHFHRQESQQGTGFPGYQPVPEVLMQRVVTPGVRYHDPGPADVRGFQQRAFPNPEPMNFQDASKMSDPTWLNGGQQTPIVMHDGIQTQWGYMQEQGATAALNNQVLPGNRTNNYLDNFRR